MKISRELLRISRPLMIFFAALLYFLGVGIARYLGALFDGGLFLLGLLWVVTIQLGAFFLMAYYDALLAMAASRQRDDEAEKLTPPMLLAIAAACLTAVASLSVLLIRFVG